MLLLLVFTQLIQPLLQCLKRLIAAFVAGNIATSCGEFFEELGKSWTVFFGPTCYDVVELILAELVRRKANHPEGGR